MRTTILTTALLVMHGLTIADEKTTTSHPTKIPESVSDRAAFTLLVSDRDGDGEMSIEEAPGPVYQNSFERFDTNGDGSLQIEEIRASKNQLSMSSAQIQLYRDFVKKYDSDASGMLSSSEVEAEERLAKSFKRWDLDVNGELSEYESAAYVRTQQVIRFQQRSAREKTSTRSNNLRIFANLAYSWSGESKSGEYRVGIDHSAVHEGEASAYIKATQGTTKFASFAQSVLADDFAGRRVELSAHVKCEDVEQGNGSSAIWLRCDGSVIEKAFDNMGPNAIRGTSDWQRVSVVLDVPPDALTLVFGGLHRGSGTAWFDDFELKVVGDDLSVTRKNRELEQPLESAERARERILEVASERFSNRPQNLSFETPARVLGVGLKNGTVSNILAGSLAERLGIQVGDMQLELNEQASTAPLVLRKTLNAAGENCTLILSREAEEISLEFKTADTEAKHKDASEWPTAAPTSQRKAFSRLGEFFLGRGDADNDGKLSKDEVPPGMVRYFDELDGDSNSELTEEEIARIPEVLRRSRQAWEGSNRQSAGTGRSR